MKNNLRVLQIIDSLRPGGAEQMAVSYANVLLGRVEGSFLCCTRIQGSLLKKLDPKLGYLFLDKRSRFSVSSFFKLRSFVIENRINLIQAHSTSFFLAVLLKLSMPKIILIWHDHYGRELKDREPGILRVASRFFDGIISVSRLLEDWSHRNLMTPNIIYIRNFLPSSRLEVDASSLKMEAMDSFKIVHLANFREQKDHISLLKAFQLLLQKDSAVSLHLMGKVNKNKCSEKVREYVTRSNLEEKVFFYGELENPQEQLRSADLGILSSKSEGLPLALLEYAQAGLPVVCTAVGECAEVLLEKGKLVPSEDPEALSAAMYFYIMNPEHRKRDATGFQAHILKHFTEEKVIPELLDFYDSILMNKNKSVGFVPLGWERS